MSGNKRIILQSYPTGVPKVENWRVEETAIPSKENLADGEILLKTLYVSVDPYLRVRLNPHSEGYFGAFPLEKPIESGLIGEVVATKSDQFKVGEFALGYLPWENYVIAKPSPMLRKLDPQIFNPLSTALYVLGMPGMTAYFGLLDITHPKEGETVVVSGAAGAVGSLVGQIAKLKGCRVVGIVGTDDKANYIKSLGFDVAVNYKTENLKEALSKACPKGVDVYFDNVGGSTLDTVLTLINPLARISLCGSISNYNETPTGIKNLFYLVSKDAKAEGFLVSRWLSEWPRGIKDMKQWITEGKIKYTETVENGIENIPKAFINMLTGGNTGKQLIKI